MRGLEKTDKGRVSVVLIHERVSEEIMGQVEPVGNSTPEDPKHVLLCFGQADM